MVLEATLPAVAGQMHPLGAAYPSLISLMETGLVNAVDEGSGFGPESQRQPKSCACITHIFGVGHRLCFELEEGWVHLLIFLGQRLGRKESSRHACRCPTMSNHPDSAPP